jgi:hypothetical protein
MDAKGSIEGIILHEGTETPLSQVHDVKTAYFPGTTNVTAALAVKVAAGEEATANFASAD